MRKWYQLGWIGVNTSNIVYFCQLGILVAILAYLSVITESMDMQKNKHISNIISYVCKSSSKLAYIVEHWVPNWLRHYSYFDRDNFFVKHKSQSSHKSLQLRLHAFIRQTVKAKSGVCTPIMFFIDTVGCRLGLLLFSVGGAEEHQYVMVSIILIQKIFFLHWLISQLWAISPTALQASLVVVKWVLPKYFTTFYMQNVWWSCFAHCIILYEYLLQGNIKVHFCYHQDWALLIMTHSMM